MRKTLLLFLALLWLGGETLPAQEPLCYVPPQKGDWSSVRGPVVSFGSTDLRYGAHTPQTGEVERFMVEGWRGERLSAQLYISTPRELEGVRCVVGDFCAKGVSLKGIAETYFVKYVISDSFEHWGKKDKSKFPSHIQPDLLDTCPEMDIEAQTTRPVWVTIAIPDEAAPGLYTAPVVVRGKGVSKRLWLELRVLERRLPPPSEWVYHLDLWQHPAAVARAERVALWSDEHMEQAKPVMKRLIDAGQKVITTTLNKDPWNQQTYDPYEDMIRWMRQTDGSWHYDFSAFDRWVKTMLELGARRYINCYSLLPWNNMLHYYDAASGKMVDVKADPLTPQFRAMWEPFLKAFVAHLREKGWIGFTNIAMDERGPEQMDIATALLKEVAPELGIAMADNQETFKRYPYLRDYCASVWSPIDPKDIRSRREQGLNTTYYVCTTSKFPNTFTSSEPAAATYISWHSAALGYDGFLRWAYNSWGENPEVDSRYAPFVAGDCFLVYPHNRSSIRFERLIEGIQDWEKLRLLREEALAKGDQQRLALLDNLLKPFQTREPFEGWQETLNEHKRILNSL